MGSRRLLTSVAVGTARAFASRNNDVDGWWAPGLMLEALPAGDPDYRLDLVTGAPTPDPTDEALRLLGSAWAHYFAWSLSRHGVGTSFVRSATLTLRFDRTMPVHSHLWERHGEPIDRPFACQVEIVDDRGRVHVGAEEDHCGRRVDFTDPDPFAQPSRATRSSSGPRILERIGHAPPSR